MKHGCSLEREGVRMKRSTESLTAIKTTVNQPGIQTSHYYASCFGKQGSIGLSANYAKEGGENDSTGDVFGKFAEKYQFSKQF